jgi:hypothetical protein
MKRFLITLLALVLLLATACGNPSTPSMKPSVESSTEPTQNEQQSNKTAEDFRCTKKTEYNNEMVIDTVQLFEYDSQGRYTKITNYYNSDDKDMVINYTETYNWTDNNNCIVHIGNIDKYSTTNIFISDDRLSATYTYEDGSKEFKKFRAPLGVQVPVSVIFLKRNDTISEDYDVDDAGKVTKVSTYHDDGSIMISFTLVYDSTDNLIEYYAYNANDTLISIYKATYNEFGCMTELVCTDVGGQIQWLRDYEYSPIN